MKDERLEKQFDEYFNGLDKPQGITAKAKNANKRGRPNGAKILKFASLAACLVLVCTVTVLALRAASPAPADPPGNGTNDGSEATYYSLSSLTAKQLDAYAIDAKAQPELAPVTKLANAANADVTQLTEYGSDGDAFIVKAEIILLDNGTRQDVTMYVEYADSICREVQYIAEGESKYYKNVPYSYVLTYDDGEPVSNFSAQKNGVKYYVCVKSSDGSAYIKYLSLIFS